MSHAEALTKPGCDKSNEAVVRKQRLRHAGFVARIGDHRLLENALLRELEGGERNLGGQGFDRPKRLRENLAAFGIGTNEKR